MSSEGQPRSVSPEDEDLEAVEDVGELNFDSANSENVPVNIFFGPEVDKYGEETGSGYFRLKAGNFMPRSGQSVDTAFEVRSKNQEALKKIVAEKIVPLYEAALARAKGIFDGTSDTLYYWDQPKKQDEHE